jgi:adenine phosphoribosyltransferase
MALDAMEKYARSRKPDCIVAIESRGFVFGGALADRLGIGLLITRKPGKLPYRTESMSYDLEYGSDSLEMHADTIKAGERVLLVDDLIATGGTIWAAARLVEKFGGEVVGVSAVIALDFLPWEEKLAGYDVDALVRYQSG